MASSNFSVESVFQYCPRCGAKSFEAIQADKFVCGECSFQYYINAAGTTAAFIVDDAGDILLIVRAKDPGAGKYGLPGGFIDLQETAEDALRREIREEVNLEINNPRFAFSFPNVYEYGGLIYHTIDFFFLAGLVDKSALRPNDEIAGCEFVDIMKFQSSGMAFVSMQNAVAALQKKIADGEITLR